MWLNEIKIFQFINPKVINSPLLMAFLKGFDCCCKTFVD